MMTDTAHIGTHEQFQISLFLPSPDRRQTVVPAVIALDHPDIERVWHLRNRESGGLIWHVLVNYWQRQLSQNTLTWYIGEEESLTDPCTNFICFPIHELAPLNPKGPLPLWNGAAGLFGFLPDDVQILPRVQALRGWHQMNIVRKGRWTSISEPQEFWWIRDFSYGWGELEGVAELMKSAVMYAEGSEHHTGDTYVWVCPEYISTLKNGMREAATAAGLDFAVMGEEDYRTFHIRAAPKFRGT
jgi:hypothetical protein